jgi:hypothetical protein
MSILSSVRDRLGESWPPAIYFEKVRSQRTRAYRIDVPPKENEVGILFTLLGIEIKVGRKRFACPDLATARYIRTFARIGCHEFAVPYDITKISSIADELEVSLHRCLLLLEDETSDRPLRSRSQFRSAIIKELRTEIEEAGPGDAMPTFKQSTRQNPHRK